MSISKSGVTSVLGVPSSKTPGDTSLYAPSNTEHLPNTLGVLGVPINKKPAHMPVSSSRDIKHPPNRLEERTHSSKKFDEEGSWECIAPVPTETKTPPEYYPKLGKFIGRWSYKDQNGKILCYIDRLQDSNGKKTYLPLTFWRNRRTGLGTWQNKALPTPRPVYNLDKLEMYPKAIVVLVEGEKCAEAAEKLFPSPEYVVTTIMNGCQATKRADYSPLIGRAVWLWPDNDKGGKEGMNSIANILKKQDTESISLFSLDNFLTLPNGATRDFLPKGWDVADAVDEGFDKSFIEQLLPTNLVKPFDYPDKVSQNQTKNNPSHQVKTSNYKLIENTEFKDGVYFFADDNSSPFWICSPLHIIARTRDEYHQNWGYQLEWKDPDGHLHTWAMPAELLSGNGEEFCKELLARGLDGIIGPRDRNHLITYIKTTSTEKRIRCTDIVGWSGEVFVLPNRTIGEPQEPILYQSNLNVTNLFREQGTLAGWKELSSLCNGNSRLLLAVSVAFASTLLKLSQNENCGFHLMGSSSEGKTTALRLAASVFGGREYMHRWNATINGLEAIASAHSDTVLILDELGQVDAKQAGEIAYMLANGSGKQRANRIGKACNKARWRSLFLSSGEIDLAQHMQETGKQARTGQQIRLLSFNSNAEKGHGIYETLHGFKDGAELSRMINEKTNQFFGTAGPAFIEHVIQNIQSLPQVIEEYKRNFINKYLPKNASGQVNRALEQFGLCAAAGMLSTRYGITNWQIEDVEAGIKKCFDAWLEQHGVENQENKIIISQIRHFFEAHGESRFADWKNPIERAISNMAGFKRKIADTWNYYVFPENFKRELCKGFDQKSVSKLLYERGYIKGDSSGKYSQPVELPGYSKKKRMYVFNETLWEEDEI